MWNRNKVLLFAAEHNSDRYNISLRDYVFGSLPPCVRQCSFTCMDCSPYGPSGAVWPLWITFYYLKHRDNYTFPSLFTHGIEIINEITCGEALGKLECALQILCMKLLSLAPYLFIKIEHTKERKKENVKAERKKTRQHILPTTRGLSSPAAERSWSRTAVACLGGGAESDSLYRFPL